MEPTPNEQRDCSSKVANRSAYTDKLSQISLLPFTNFDSAVFTTAQRLTGNKRIGSKPSKPIVATASLIDRVNDRLIKLHENEKQPKQSLSETDLVVTKTSVTKSEHMKEPWQHHRRVLSMVFAIWFILAIGLLLSTIYSF